MSLPRGTSSMALGYYEDAYLVWLLGGYLNPRSLMSYNLSSWNQNNTFTDYGTNEVFYQVRPWPQAYIQIQDTLCVIEVNGNNQLLTFDLSTGNLNTINTNPSSYTLDTEGCMSNIDGYIIYTCLSSTYILTISTMSWILTGNPIMSTSR